MTRRQRWLMVVLPYLLLGVTWVATVAGIQHQDDKRAETECEIRLDGRDGIRGLIAYMLNLNPAVTPMELVIMKYLDDKLPPLECVNGRTVVVTTSTPATLPVPTSPPTSAG